MQTHENSSMGGQFPTRCTTVIGVSPSSLGKSLKQAFIFFFFSSKLLVTYWALRPRTLNALPILNPKLLL